MIYADPININPVMPSASQKDIVLCLFTPDEVREVAGSSRLRHCAKLYCSTEAYAEGVKENLSGNGLWEYTSAVETRKLTKSSWELCSEFAEILKGGLDPLWADLMYVTRRDMWFPFYYTLLCNWSFNRFLEKVRPGAIWAFSAREPRASSMIAQCASHALAVLQYACRTHACPFLQLPEISSEAILGDMRLASRTLRREGAVGNASINTLPKNVNTVLFCYGMLGVNEQWNLLERVANDEADTSIFCLEESDAFGLGQLRVGGLERLPVRSALVKKLQAVFSRAYTAAFESVQHEWASIFRESELAFLGKEFERSLAASAGYAVVGECLTMGLRPRLFVSSNNLFGHMRVLAQMMRSGGSATVEVHHTGLDRHRSSPLNTNVGGKGDVAVWGAVDAEYVMTGSDLCRPRQIGVLRRDITLESPSYSTIQRSSICLLTSRITYHRGYLCELKCHFKALQVLFDRLAVRGVPVFVKMHPSCDFPQIYRAFAERARMEVDISAGNPKEVLNKARVALMVSHASTAATEALACGVPVLFLRQCVNSEEISGLESVGAVHACATMAELERELDRLLADDEYHGQMLARQRAGLQRAIVAHGDEAVDRMLALMDELGQEARPGPVDPWARWILDVLQFMDHWVQGGLSKSECQARYRTLREQGRRCAPGEYRYLDAARLPGEYMRMCIWRNAFARSQNVSLPDAEADENAGACGRVPNRVRMVWKIGRLFPAAMRPALRPYVVQALLEEASEAAPDRVLYRKFMQTMALILAPGRLFRS
jgi:hypothetical protein